MESQITGPISALHHYRAMNIFSADGSQVKDSSGLWHATEVWHPEPIPSIQRIDLHYKDGFWLVRKPLPPVPRVKTQQGLDQEALLKWYQEKHATTSVQSAWHAALAWERARNP